MSSYREQSLKAKAVRKGIVDQPTGKSKNKRPTPYVIEYHAKQKNGLIDPSKWHKWHTYRTRDEMLQALRKFERNYTFWLWRESPKNPKE